MAAILVLVLIAGGTTLYILWKKVKQHEKEIAELKQWVRYNSQPQQPSTQPQQTYTSPQPYTVAGAVTHPKREAVAGGKTITLENLLGRNVLGIAASVLVFIGLIFLGTLVYKQFTETMKIIAMYAISAVVTGLGVFLAVKKRNNFTLILTGCGCGSFFISILLTHIYFNRINDLAAFSLLLVWMASILLLSRAMNSTTLSIVAHIGMIISICFAFLNGLSDEKLLLLLIYQGAAIAVIILGNILCCKKTYDLGVFISLLLTIAASCFMWDRFTAHPYAPESFPFATALPPAGIAAAFAAQFLCASFLSYLLYLSAGRLKDETHSMLVHAANKVLWLAALVMNVYHVVYRISAGISAENFMDMTANDRLTAALFAVLVSMAAILVHAGLTLLLSKKHRFSGLLETFSILFLSAVSAVLLFVLWGFQLDADIDFPRISFLFVLSLLLFSVNRFSRKKAYVAGAYAILAIDAIFMIFDGYHNLDEYGTIALSGWYMLLYLAVIWLRWLRGEGPERTKSGMWVRLASLILVEASIISIITGADIRYDSEITLLLLTGLNIILFIFKYDRIAASLKKAMLINQHILLSFASGYIAFSEKDRTSAILFMLLAVLAFGLSFIRIREVFEEGDRKLPGILTGIKLSVLVLATVYGNTNWFDQAYFLSIACMLTALVSIIAGFAGRAKYLRLYGLVLTLVCVLKLVTYDVMNLNTPLRVVAFIGGGIICFLISAIYNYTSGKIDNIST
ncbi:MAG: DUF2339 domain-containing protein [Clostridiales bacterium]|nr:DUF2339 domain-containing protein [Clostridiales bacterium]